MRTVWAPTSAVRQPCVPRGATRRGRSIIIGSSSAGPAGSSRSSRSSSSAGPAGSGSSRSGSSAGSSSLGARLLLAREQLDSSLRAKRINRSKIAQLVQLVEALTAAQLAETAAKTAVAEKSLLEMQAQKLVADILGERGMLHALGLLDYAEGDLFRYLDPDVRRDRKARWSTLGSSHKALEACIVNATSWEAEWIPDKAVQLHNHLVALERSGAMPLATTSKVPLVEGPLDLEEMRFLECVAKAVLCPVTLHYRPPPTASM